MLLAGIDRRLGAVVVDIDDDDDDDDDESP